MIELNFQQGSPEWMASRKTTRNASDYPSAQGLSKKFSRSDLVREAATGIAREFSPYVEEKILPNGHRIEALARPIAEEIIGEELFPIVAKSDDGYLGASCDGATMLLDTGWECKQWNEDLAAAVAITGRVPETHVGQLDQQGLVFGFGRILFMVTDGTPEKCIYCWHTPTVEAKDKIRPTWNQFDEDVANYQHIEAKPAVVADSIEDLPALTVQLVGQVTASNLDSFTTAVTARIQAINTKLVTDADFVNADKMVKFLGDGEKRLDLVKDQALAQTASIDQLFRTIDVLKEQMRGKRLALEKLVKAEKENRKSEIVHAARVELVGHVQNLHSRIGFTCIQIDSSVFGEATKGLKSLDSMRDKVSAALANAKIEARAIADRIEFNQKQMQAKSAAVLFPDFAQVCAKAPDDFAALVDARIAKKKEADDNLLAAEREKIRAEEVARANAEAVAKIMAPAPVAAETTKAPDPCLANDSRRIGLGASASRLIDSISEIKRIKLGTICARLGFTMTAEFVESLGFRPVGHDKNAKLYSETQFLEICEALIQHISKQANAERSE